jgi:hypothetical protein
MRDHSAELRIICSAAVGRLCGRVHMSVGHLFWYPSLSFVDARRFFPRECNEIVVDRATSKAKVDT